MLQYYEERTQPANFYEVHKSDLNLELLGEIHEKLGTLKDYRCFFKSSIGN